jgi:hypothetical protein
MSLGDILSPTSRRTVLHLRSRLVTAETRRAKKVAWMKARRAEARAYGIPTGTPNMCAAVRREREARAARTAFAPTLHPAYRATVTPARQAARTPAGRVPGCGCDYHCACDSVASQAAL